MESHIGLITHKPRGNWPVFNVEAPGYHPPYQQYFTRRTMTNVAITGHRPEKVGKYEPLVRQALRVAYEDLGAYRVIQGMASGVDLWAASEAFHANIPFVAVRPWAGHKPRRLDKVAYEMAVKHADEVVNVSDAEEYPGPWAYHERNHWMVHRCNILIAVWDGSETGGTYECLTYAEKMKTPVYYINPMSGIGSFARPV